MIEKRGYVKFGIIGGILINVVWLLYIFSFFNSNVGLMGFLIFLPIIPGDLILNIFTAADPIFLGTYLAVWISILFWFVIGFLLGMLVYKLYLIKNE